MSLKIALLKIVSRFTKKPIDVGFTVSTDTDLTVPAALVTKGVDGTNTTLGRYFKLKEAFGPFEFVGFIKSGETNLYQLRHCYTGETFNLTKTMFELLFEKL